MKTLVLALLLVSSPFAVAAPHEAAGPVVDPAAGAVAAPAEDTVRISAADTEVEKPCVRETGTRVPSRDEDGCNGLPGEAYDKAQIDRSGAIDTADAIRRLSPSATVRR